MGWQVRVVMVEVWAEKTKEIAMFLVERRIKETQEETTRVLQLGRARGPFYVTADLDYKYGIRGAG